MDFVNRLKLEQLQSFWYFALVGTFGSLLWATSGNKGEADFYRSRLGEYCWTLRVSNKGAEPINFAAGMLDEEMMRVMDFVADGSTIVEAIPEDYSSHDATAASAFLPLSENGISEQHSGLVSPSTSASGSSGAYETFK
jgi:hypothetical protein